MKSTAKNLPSKDWARNNGGRNTSSVWGIGGVKGELLSWIGTIAIASGAPAFTMFVCVVHTKFGGSVWDFVERVRTEDLTSIQDLYPLPNREAWQIFIVFGLIQALLQLFLPGKIVIGPITPKGNTPIYKANGVQSFVVTLFLFGVGWWSGAFSPARIYDLFPEILSTLNIFALGLCGFLYIKGHYFPSSSDSGSTGSIIYDFYWGVELYPRIGKWFDIKTWTNCRIGMMSWGVLILCYAAKQYELYGHVADSMIVSVVLMEFYILKFFLWEAGYWCSMDIAHDRAGYYLCWGCLNWVPGIYTSPALYLVANPVHLGFPLASFFFVCGLLCIYINYDADRQRQNFRKQQGKLKIWGKAPRTIVAQYRTGNGETKTSLLLASGWWGVARHFHYIPEILGAFFWTVPGLFYNGLQFFYLIFLTLLLMDRVYRDDERCMAKYGEHWNTYCKLVPFKLIPGLF